MQVVRVVRRAVASDIFRGSSIFAGALAALLVSVVVRELSETIHDQHTERICWFERTAEVDEITARMQAVNGRIFELAILNPQEDPPELRELARELNTLTSRLEPAIEAQVEATKDC